MHVRSIPKAFSELSNLVQDRHICQSGGIGEVKFARGLCYKRRKSIGSLGDYPVPDSIDFNLWSGPATYTDPKVTRQRFDKGLLAFVEHLKERQSRGR